ncbi:hypothetical protein UlMin_032320 [Ulmus minor]
MMKLPQYFYLFYFYFYFFLFPFSFFLPSPLPTLPNPNPNSNLSQNPNHNHLLKSHLNAPFSPQNLLCFLKLNPCPCSNGIFSCSQTEPIFRFAINACCRVRKLDDVVVAFDSMRKLIDGKPSVLYNRMIRDRVKPDLFTFNILLSSYCRNSQCGLALDLFKEMKEKGASPNVISFNTMIKIRKFQKAKKKRLGRVGRGKEKKKKKKGKERKKKVRGNFVILLSKKMLRVPRCDLLQTRGSILLFFKIRDNFYNFM